ncbi:MAG: SPFH domain-containing protein, partial [Clostridium sp.]
MGIFNQFQSLVEWKETRDDVIFHMCKNRELKKDSKVIIRPGQDAIFMYNGVVEGFFEEEGEYILWSDIIPFLTTLKSFKFGFNTPLRAEVMFINTKD